MGQQKPFWVVALHVREWFSSRDKPSGCLIRLLFTDRTHMPCFGDGNQATMRCRPAVDTVFAMEISPGPSSKNSSFSGTGAGVHASAARRACCGAATARTGGRGRCAAPAGGPACGGPRAPPPCVKTVALLLPRLDMIRPPSFAPLLLIQCQQRWTLVWLLFKHQ